MMKSKLKLQKKFINETAPLMNSKKIKNAAMLLGEEIPPFMPGTFLLILKTLARREKLNHVERLLSSWIDYMQNTVLFSEPRIAFLSSFENDAIVLELTDLGEKITELLNRKRLIHLIHEMEKKLQNKEILENIINDFLIQIKIKTDEKTNSNSFEIEV